ncbi:flagellar hook-associated protein FlgK [Bartonella bacilliformis str. Heidi Mejia]|uniref:Flagellar hook-associated protein 1 n=2 Tax=Bartonella bacilliformis TaxID=774 RepID=A1UTS9_BARBK|nr:flagellar hook-associated protein FlgK [Bartonella bacilliformis]ABM44591.1 flagellar hook-associated protein FlgK [Bartonella bacilliformis KC583]AMG86127.1 flagellar hook-associated protein FlgK [Bartonella bacilliformis]EKS43376.1 flagellar hook-associated protein FlgK [Bartonella bacilliformis INS]EYS88642.1 flagellar hook-associated protein FlgK [Bartonella bacilliformis San Pedro600-02]EYS91065.1 flagellar hook-associated protein FlgK [Bartonella bacilliformis str. Heidi Mejia]
MALSSALNTARNSLKATTSQFDVVAKNIAGARDPNYTRRTSYLESGPRGAVHVAVRRDDSPFLLDNYLVKSSQAAAAGSLANGLHRLAEIHGADGFSNSPSQLLSDFQKALQAYANDPDQRAAGDAAVDRARDLVNALNKGNREIEKLRNDADSDIQDSVDHINDLLQKFHDLDQKVVQEKNAGRDAYSYMDQRDAVLKQLSQEIGINTVSHQDGSTSIYGMDGSTLYDKSPRKVTFESSNSLPAGVAGKQVFVDGVPLGHPSFVEPNGGGNLGGLLKVRDEMAPQYQKQLDEMASALMSIFPGPPPLFLDSDKPEGEIGPMVGLSGRIKLNPIFDSNTPGGGPEHFGKDIQSLVDAFDQKREFGSDTGLATEQSLMSFGKNSMGWLEGVRSDADKNAKYQGTMFARAAEALSNETGVNTDDEMAVMLQLEQAYAATTRIISTVGKMLDDLMIAIR